LTPKQVNLDVEQRFERIIPLDIQVMEEPPRTVKLESLTANANQILVTGTEDEVDRVAFLTQVALGLSSTKRCLPSPFSPVSWHSMNCPREQSDPQAQSSDGCGELPQ
jgi:hypothetical protein